MIEAKHLTKIFGRKTAVDDISFTVGKGEILGVLGPNAAGKSTTMRMITGFLLPTSGTALVGGHDVLESSLSARQKIGYLPENAPTYPDMTVNGFLDFIAEIRGFRGQSKKQQVARTLERCNLLEVRYQAIQTLSKGFKQRVCFAQSILHDPEYLIMDEPTDGLDPNQKHEVRNMIRTMAQNKTIILSTHNLEELDAVCTRVLIIAQGRIVADETPSGLKTWSALHGAVCFTLPKIGEGNWLKETEEIPGVDRAVIVREEAASVTIRAFPKKPDEPLTEKIIHHFMAKGKPVEKIFIEEGRLDEVFRMITTQSL